MDGEYKVSISPVPSPKARRRTLAVKRKKLSLPNNFFQNIIDLENTLLEEKSMSKISELIKLYKIGVEYYSGTNVELQKHFNTKIKEVFMDKSTIQVLKLKKNSNDSKKSLEKESALNSEEILNTISTITSVEEKNTVNQSTNSNHRRVKSFVCQNNHLTESKLNKISAKLSKLKEEGKRVKTSFFKTVIENFHQKIEKTLNLINSEISDQSSQMKKRILNKKPQTKPKMVSLLNIPNLSLLAPVKINHKINETEMISTKPVPNTVYSLLDNNNPQKIRIKLKDINSSLEEFITSFHQIYFNQLKKKVLTKLTDLLNEHINNQFKSYHQIEEDIEELEYLFKKEELITNYEIQVENLRKAFFLQYEKNQISMNLKFKERLNEIKNEKDQLFLEVHEKSNQSIDILMSSIIDLLK